MGVAPCFLKIRVMSANQSFRPVAPFFFVAKVPIMDFLKYRMGCGHIDILMTFP